MDTFKLVRVSKLLFSDMNQKKFEKKPMISQAKIVGMARNVFGTRLCQRIECSRCHEIDYVPLRIKDAKTIYCRACAEKLLLTYEAGRAISEKQFKRNCSQCRCEFLVNETVALKKEELMCKDCYRGFEVWRGKAQDVKDGKQARYIIKKSGTATILRKTLNDTI